MKTILLGAAYYPEHDPESERKQDAKLIRELGFNTIRVGEFCWNRMQMADSGFTLDWLERLISVFDSHGIKTIPCTPTITPPVRVMECFPDLPVVLPNGRGGKFGGRRYYSTFHEGYRYEFLMNGSTRPARLARPIHDLITGNTIPTIPIYGTALWKTSV